MKFRRVKNGNKNNKREKNEWKAIDFTYATNVEQTIEKKLETVKKKPFEFDCQNNTHITLTETETNSWQRRERELKMKQNNGKKCCNISLVFESRPSIPSTGKWVSERAN